MNKLIFIFALLLLFSCQSQKKIAQQQKHNSETVCKPMLLLTEETAATASDTYHLDSLAIQNHCLEVFVSYSGGCGEAGFALYNSNRVMESMPPQTTLILDFKDDDPCRSIVRDTLYFDLSEFKELASSGGIWLKVKDSDKRVLYKFSDEIVNVFVINVVVHKLD